MNQHLETRQARVEGAQAVIRATIEGGTKMKRTMVARMLQNLGMNAAASIVWASENVPSADAMFYRVTFERPLREQEDTWSGWADSIAEAEAIAVLWARETMNWRKVAILKTETPDFVRVADYFPASAR